MFSYLKEKPRLAVTLVFTGMFLVGTYMRLEDPALVLTLAGGIGALLTLLVALESGKF